MVKGREGRKREEVEEEDEGGDWGRGAGKKRAGNLEVGREGRLMEERKEEAEGKAEED